MCNFWIYPWEINKDKLRDHTNVQSLNLTASETIPAHISWLINAQATTLKSVCQVIHVVLIPISIFS